MAATADAAANESGSQAPASLSRDAQPRQSLQPAEKNHLAHDPLTDHDHPPPPRPFLVTFASRVEHLIFLWSAEPKLQRPVVVAPEPCASPHGDERCLSLLGCFQPPRPQERAPRWYSSIAAHFFRDISSMSCTTRYGSLLASSNCTRRRTSSRKPGGVRPAIIALATIAPGPFAHRPSGINTADNLRSWRISWTFSCTANA